LATWPRSKPEFDKRGVKIIGLSVDPLGRHSGWANDIKETQALPELSDDRRHRLYVSKLYDMLPAPVSGDPTKRTAADNQTVRNVFVIGPDKKVKLILVYPMTTGRNSTKCCASSTRCNSPRSTRWQRR